MSVSGVLIGVGPDAVSGQRHLAMGDRMSPMGGLAFRRMPSLAAVVRVGVASRTPQFVGQLRIEGEGP